MNSNDKTVLLLLISAILLLISQLIENSLFFCNSISNINIFMDVARCVKKNGKVRGGAKYSLVGLLIIWLVGFIAMERIDHSNFGKFFLEAYR